MKVERSLKGMRALFRSSGNLQVFPAIRAIDLDRILRFGEKAATARAFRLRPAFPFFSFPFLPFFAPRGK